MEPRMEFIVQGICQKVRTFETVGKFEKRNRQIDRKNFFGSPFREKAAVPRLAPGTNTIKLFCDKTTSQQIGLDL